MADFLDEGGRIAAIIIDFSKDSDLVPFNWLLRKTVASEVINCKGVGIPTASEKFTQI
jgi:hypothetical protein